MPRMRSVFRCQACIAGRFLDRDMSTKNDGGPVFPVNEKCADGAHHQTIMGMTLRDWFAAKALMGLLAEPFMDGCVSSSIHCTPNFDDASSQPGDRIATAAYALADAMLRARGK